MKGKSSFVLYTDLLEIVEVLSNEQAGLLFKTVLRYVNDLNPEIPKEIQLAFIPIKQSLKRDLEKWEDIKIKRSEAGKKHKGNQYTLEQDGTNGTSVPTMEQNGTNGTDNVNVNVNDNVNVSVNVNDSVNNNKSLSKPKPVKHKYGTYGWILLTEEQHQKLEEEYGTDKLQQYINNLDEYIQQSGNKNKYKDFNLVLRKSIRENWSIHKNTNFTSNNKTQIIFEEG